MVYADDMSGVKLVLDIPDDDVNDDDLIQRCQNQAFAWMNREAKQYTAVPLTGDDITDDVKEIEDDIAAGYFREVKTKPVEGERVKKHIFRERGEDNWFSYIANNFKPKGANRRRFCVHGKSGQRFQVDVQDTGYS